MQYVSEFTENDMDGAQLEKVYSKIKSGKASSAAVHSVGLGINGMLYCDVACDYIRPYKHFLLIWLFICLANLIDAVYLESVLDSLSVIWIGCCACSKQEEPKLT